jgi:heat shock protein HtpX
MQLETFYRQQSANRRDSLLLALGVALILGALIGIIAFLWGSDLVFSGGAAIVAVIVGLIAAFVSYRFGDRMVIASSGAHEVTEADEPQLFHVVTELAIAANIPMPRVYVIEDPALNAFATGRDPKHASVAITRGLLSKLDREELMGVLGHELSHVRNLDIRYSLLVGVLVGSVVLVADVLLRVTVFGGGRGRGRGEGGSGAIVLLVSLVIASIAAVLAKLIELAASRQREYLADASSVELTRNPVGLERALILLASDETPLHHANRATQHLFFVNPFKRRGSLGLFSTHPPLRDRVLRLRRLTGEGDLPPELEAQLAERA